MSSASIDVLLIEDNPGDARLLRALLQETASPQFELVHAERFSEALTRLSERRFDVVLLDLSLPDAQGLETISRLGRQAEGTPSEILTGLNDEEIAIRALQQGAKDYLVKGQWRSVAGARPALPIERHKAEESLKARNRELMVLRKISEADWRHWTSIRCSNTFLNRPFSSVRSTLAIFDCLNRMAILFRWGCSWPSRSKMSPVTAQSPA